jgi:aspartyl-tRNA(Asn)/glutamyl-tRNA(Gln) amidotransferase subunit B
MELGALFKNEDWSESRVTSEQLASIIVHLLRKQITGRTAKLLLALKFEGDTRPIEQIIVDEDMLLRPLPREEYISMAQALLEEKSDVVKDIVEKGKHQKVKWFVGQMMARGAEGTVEPGTAEAVLRELLQLPPMQEQGRNRGSLDTGVRDATN